jgi:NAD kinase
MTSSKVPASCKIYAGNVSTSLIGTRVGDGIIVSTGTGTTVVCPEGVSSTMPIHA